MADNIRAAIARLADPDVEVLEVAILTDNADGSFGFRLIGDESEAGGAPRALTDANGALAFEKCECRSNERTYEPSALERTVVIAEARLQLADRRAEIHQMAFCHGRKRLHENQTAKVSGIIGGEFGHVLEGRVLFCAVDAPSAGIDDDQHPPSFGKGKLADHRRNELRPAAAIDDQPAPVEKCNADAGPRAAAQADGVGLVIERQAVQAAHRRRRGQRHLRAGPEADVERDRLDRCPAPIRASVERP
jgi:hypothetical protein